MTENTKLISSKNLEKMARDNPIPNGALFYVTTDRTEDNRFYEGLAKNMGLVANSAFVLPERVVYTNSNGVVETEIETPMGRTSRYHGIVGNQIDFSKKLKEKGYGGLRQLDERLDSAGISHLLDESNGLFELYSMSGQKTTFEERLYEAAKKEIETNGVDPTKNILTINAAIRLLNKSGNKNLAKEITNLRKQKISDSNSTIGFPRTVSPLPA